MNSLALFPQMLAVAVAIVIGYFYVQPTIDEIGQLQTDTSRYQVEREKVQAVNAQLAASVANEESIPPADRQRLAIYMPRTIDDVSIMRDITYIVRESNLANTALSYGGRLDSDEPTFSQSSNDAMLGFEPATPYAFSVGVSGTYPQIKDFLRLLEQNEYPLDVYSMSLSADETGVMTSTLTLVTYADEGILIDSTQ